MCEVLDGHRLSAVLTVIHFVLVFSPPTYFKKKRKVILIHERVTFQIYMEMASCRLLYAK